MRTTARLLTGTALAVAAIGAFAAPAAYANDDSWSSNGESWSSGDENWNSGGGGHESLELSPSSASPGETVTVNTLACGKHGHGVGDANSLGAGEFQLKPSTHKEVVVGQFTVPEHVKAGSYGISVACDNGKTAKGDLWVKHRGPSGHVQTGVGGSVGPDTAQVTAGAAVLAAAAVGGVWLLRRRASGAQGH
ncbi:hypothetical protein GCM10010275_21430 [Streptomyces litmocidini]|uniref:hypothetical protein n=1 Tax=Streptomyces litmocidini TaxID=67318 RepID=UPI00167C5707|nr:hypothetical protein [Streptomyces litmocidini]GGU85729.1 hypothetical protein GCM10010275_21430 [Streptomyces litmocidini]